MKTTQPHPDPLIDEVRERRREIWDQCDHDFNKLVERIRRIQEEHPDKLVDATKLQPTEKNRDGIP